MHYNKDKALPVDRTRAMCAIVRSHADKEGAFQQLLPSVIPCLFLAKVPSALSGNNGSAHFLRFWSLDLHIRLFNKKSQCLLCGNFSCLVITA